ncbi:MAG: hypothetical protein DWI24_03990 [Planctomycetota bacterium]|nr:MAG: hypothetical protein DWI24_03990 [Planctomycetota bacterium]
MIFRAPGKACPTPTGNPSTGYDHELYAFPIRRYRAIGLSLKFNQACLSQLEMSTSQIYQSRKKSRFFFQPIQPQATEQGLPVEFPARPLDPSGFFNF